MKKVPAANNKLLPAW